jgi:hypothetical protein
MFDRAAPVTAIVKGTVCRVPGWPVYVQTQLLLLLLTWDCCCAAACCVVDVLRGCNLKTLLCVREAPAYQAAELLRQDSRQVLTALVCREAGAAVAA